MKKVATLEDSFVTWYDQASDDIVFNLNPLIKTNIETLESGRHLAIARCDLLGFFGVSPNGDTQEAKLDLLTSMQTFFIKLKIKNNLLQYLTKMGFQFEDEEDGSLSTK